MRSCRLYGLSPFDDIVRMSANGDKRPFMCMAGRWRCVSLRLFENRHLTLAQAARLAGLSVEEFVVLLGEAGIPVADYPAEELEEEAGTAS